MSVRFSQRANHHEEKEFLDHPDVRGEDLEQNLRELKFINTTLGGNNVTVSALKHVLRNSPREHWSIADIGCGGGDILQLISTEMRKQKRPFTLTGIDVNENILRYAMLNTFEYGEIHYLCSDVLSETFDASSYDILNATLFLHHFTDEQLRGLLNHLRKQVKVAVIINDLHRHSLAYYSIKWLTGLFSKSHMVKHDAPLSVRRGFSRKELLSLATDAGFRKVELSWCWAFRWKMVLWT